MPLHTSFVSKLTRREMLFLLSAFVSGCSQVRGPTENTLKLFGTATMDIGVRWSKLRKELGISINFTDNGNEPGPVIEKMVHGTAASDYDVGAIQGGTELELAQAGKILPWDVTKIPNWNTLWDLASLKHAIVDNKQYGLPTVINTDSMIYRHDRLQSVDSYGVIFDKSLRGRTTMEDSWVNSILFTAMFLKRGMGAHIANPADLTDSELGLVMDFLTKHKRDGQFVRFWNGWKDGLDLITNDRVSVMTGWEPIAYEAKAEGVPAEYAQPHEGYEAWSNDLVLHTGARDRKLVDVAHEFANWELDGYYGCVLEERGYVVPHDKAVIYAYEHQEEHFSVQQLRAKLESVWKRINYAPIVWQNVRPKLHVQYEKEWQLFKSQPGFV